MIELYIQKMLWEAKRRKHPITKAFCLWDPGCHCEKRKQYTRICGYIKAYSNIRYKNECVEV